MELADRLKRQAEGFGAEIATAEVVTIEDAADGVGKAVRTKDGPVKGIAVIIATGASAKKLGIPGEAEFFGRGVSVCATCDAPLYRDRTAVVVGGGETAVEEATFLARFTKKLILVHRRDRLRATNAAQDRFFAHGDKVGVEWDSVATAIAGKDAVEGLEVKNMKTGETKTIPCDGVFVLIGHVPNTGFLRGVVEMNESGHILTDDAMATSAEGIYACGDVRREWFKQMVTACGEGAIAAYSAQRYIEDKKGTAYPGR
jgi:thioredoxin reductase (NADPH)